jgi:hypothetical protein
MSVKRPNLVSLKPSPNLTLKILDIPNLKWWGPRGQIIPYASSISCMSKGKKMKLAFHAVVANYCGNLVVSSNIFNVVTCLTIGSMSTYKYFQTTILECNRASRPVPIPPNSSSNVIRSLGSVQVISWRSISLIGSPWLSMFSKLDKVLTKGSWAALNFCETSGLCWMSVGTTFKLSVACA